MGLAASQGRLLLLTARKSDLEFQAQAISQQRLLLSMEQERIATEYSDKINNQVLQLQVNKTDGSNDTEFVALTLENLIRWNSKAKITDTQTGKSVLVTSDEAKKLYNSKGDGTPDNALQLGLETGRYFIELPNEKEQYVKISPDGQSTMKKTYYTEDDSAAKADYDAAMARVQRLDKQLEVKLNQIETQHKAVETEVESVNKVIQNNIEGSFKYFS